MSVVANPKREVRINYNIVSIRSAIKLIPKYAPNAELTIANDVMNFYQFKAAAKGIFSLGMFLEISLHEIS